MAFSWKQKKKDSLKKMKETRQIYLKLGDNMAAKKEERKIERLEKHG